MKKKPIPRVEKYVRKDGTPVHREYHRFSDIPLPSKEEHDESYTKALLKLTPKRDLAQLEKHFKGGDKSPKPDGVHSKISLPYDSLRRVYAFVIMKADTEGLIDLVCLGKTKLIEYIKTQPKIKASGNTIYQTIKTGYKEEYAFNFEGNYAKAIKDFKPDYDYAMTIFKDIYPD